MKNALFTSIMVAGYFITHAQQESNLSFHSFNPLAINSGYVGVNEGLNCVLINREQWTGVPGHPKTNLVSVDSPLNGHNLALGSSFSSDQIGPLRSTTATIDFAYRLYLTKKTRLAFGVKGSINSQSLRFSELKNIDQADINFSQDFKFKPQPNIGFGIYLWNEKYFAGISIPTLIEQSQEYQDGTVFGTKKRHHYLHGGAILEINDQMKLKPTLLIRHTNGSPLAVDLGGTVIMNDFLFVGMSYRYRQAWGANIMLTLHERFKVGYAFERSHPTIQSISGGTHEVLIGYLLKYKNRGQFNRIYF